MRADTLGQLKVAYIGCQWSLISGTQRRSNADDHDKEFIPAKKVFEENGDQLEEADWRCFDFENTKFDLIFARTVWDYVRHKSEFIEFLRKAEEYSILANSSKIIEWNIEKYYLREFHKMELPVINSFFPDEPTPILEIFDHLETNEIVVKPVLGEGGYGITRYKRSELGETPEILVQTNHFVQPMMPSIISEGEISMVFIGGKFTHAVLKKCADGEYRVQTSHGGTEEAYAPSAQEIVLATRFVDALPDSPLACRVDFIREGKSLLLMELEAIEPILYPHFLPDFGKVIYVACREYIEKHKK